ncbi:MAG: cya 1, partial [Lacunisphaera sp.]|nr:cya 1 [Lacunisphaera sp.]
MLLSGDGLMGTDLLPALKSNHVAMAEVVLVETRMPANPVEQDNGSNLVDTTPVVQTAATSVTPAVPPTSQPATLPVSTPAPAAPTVTSSADFSVLTLTASNGPPASGLTTSFEDLDPPLGGFNFTITGGAGAAAIDQALTDLFNEVSTGAVDFSGSVAKADGSLSLVGSFHVAWNSGTDSGGHRLFEVGFANVTGALT